jgi:hypothetical protein
VKFLITMNMPSGQGYLVHQVTIEHRAKSCVEFCEMLNTDVFIVGRQLYRKRSPNMEPIWQDRGEIVLNTAHIGKVAEFVEFDKEDDDESYGHTDNRRQHTPGTRPPIRPRGTVF